jgi:adenylylsulfate kinase
VTEIKATNITWHEGHVGRDAREKSLGQKGCLIWFTGLSGSGKSTIAYTVEHELMKRGRLCYVLDGDNIRHGLNKNLGFSAADRAENIRRIGEVGKLFVDAGLITMTAFISPYRADRDAARALFKDGEFIEVFMDVPIEICETRDPKGLYKKARAGEIKGFTGIDDPYEAPERPELVVRNGACSREDAAVQIINYLQSKKVISLGA